MTSRLLPSDKEKLSLSEAFWGTGVLMVGAILLHAFQVALLNEPFHDSSCLGLSIILLRSRLFRPSAGYASQQGWPQHDCEDDKLKECV